MIMANPATTPEHHPTAAQTLQRGKACLRCRKRKMRCDGAKPACQQCLRSKKGDQCEYDDGKGKTRTQILKETISRLEARVRELEEHNHIPSSISLADPVVLNASSYGPFSHTRSGSSSSLDSPRSFGSDPSHSPSASWLGFNGLSSPSPGPYDIFPAQDDSQLPNQVAHSLLDIFEPHAAQFAPMLHMSRLRDSLFAPINKQRHPALLNTVYLLACFVSRPAQLSQQEDLYLAQALDGIRDALRLHDRLLDVIQASAMLALYFLVNGRVLEGSYHLQTAASLCVQCGLHGGFRSENILGVSDSLAVPLRVSAAADRIEEGERVRTFWYVFSLDRAWSVVLRKPTTIADDASLFTSIHAPWPMDWAEYEAGQPDAASAFNVVKVFLDGGSTSALDMSEFSPLTLRAKATALFERADSLAADNDPRLTSVGMLESFAVLELRIEQFISQLIPLHQLVSACPSPLDRQNLLTVHSLAQAALIHLYRRYSESDRAGYDKCLRAAHNCARVVKATTSEDLTCLPPIIGACWASAADILIRELDSNLAGLWPANPSVDLRTEVGMVLFGLNHLSSRFPYLGMTVERFSKRLSGL